MKILAAKTDKSNFAELRKTQFSNISLYRFLQTKTILNYEILRTGALERCKIWAGVQDLLKLGQRVVNWGAGEGGRAVNPPAS